MPLYVVGAIVTVVRNGKRIKVKPNGGPFDFTAEEIESLDASGVRIEPFKATPNAQVVSAGAVKQAKAEPEAEPEAEPDAKAKTGKTKTGKGKTEVTSDALEDEDI